MTEETLQALQRQLSEMLFSFSDFCDKSGFTTFLVGGSALGAKRNQGFIPWDDDIDIAMMRSDFEKMERCMQAQGNRLGELWYSPVEHHIVNEAPIGHLYRVRELEDGIELLAKLDIHPIDGVPKGKLARKMQKYAALIYYLCIYRLPIKNKGKTIRTISKIILKITPDKLFRFYQRTCKKFFTRWDDATSEDVCSLFGVAGYETEVMPRSYLMPLVRTPFEQYEFWMPGNIDVYLKRLYGDYEKLPPESDRHPQHDGQRLFVSNEDLRKNEKRR